MKNERIVLVENLYVVLMGLGVVFIGLICIIIICIIMSKICRIFEKKADKSSAESQNSVDTDKIPDRGEFIAAISAAIAEEEGTNASSIRILSVKKI